MIFRQKTVQLLNQISHNLRIRHIQHILVPPHQDFPVLIMQRPIRMIPIQLAMWTYHLRFHPDSKLHSHIIDMSNQLSQSTGKFLRIGIPVPQSVLIAGPSLKPAVIHDKQLYPQRRRFLRQLQLFFHRHVKFCHTPGIIKHRQYLTCTLLRHQVSLCKAGHGPGHFPKPMAAVSCIHRGSYKTLSFSQLPLKIHVLNPGQNIDIITGNCFQRYLEITGIGQRPIIHVPMFLIRIPVYNKTRISLMGRQTKPALINFFSGCQRILGILELSAPESGKIDALVSGTRHPELS